MQHFSQLLESNTRIRYFSQLLEQKDCLVD